MIPCALQRPGGLIPGVGARVIHVGSPVRRMTINSSTHAPRPHNTESSGRKSVGVIIGGGFLCAKRWVAPFFSDNSLPRCGLR